MDSLNVQRIDSIDFIYIVIVDFMTIYRCDCMPSN
jgi:hypothetical protein